LRAGLQFSQLSALTTKYILAVVQKALPAGHVSKASFGNTAVANSLSQTRTFLDRHLAHSCSSRFPEHITTPATHTFPPEVIIANRHIKA